MRRAKGVGDPLVGTIFLQSDWAHLGFGLDFTKGFKLKLNWVGQMRLPWCERVDDSVRESTRGDGCL